MIRSLRGKPASGRFGDGRRPVQVEKGIHGTDATCNVCRHERPRALRARPPPRRPSSLGPAGSVLSHPARRTRYPAVPFRGAPVSVHSPPGFSAVSLSRRVYQHGLPGSLPSPHPRNLSTRLEPSSTQSPKPTPCPLKVVEHSDLSQPTPPPHLRPGRVPR